MAGRALRSRCRTAFADFERLFSGQFPGYFGCDTVYHDMQHSLDDTLAMARLLAGYDRTHAPDQRLGGDRALMGLVSRCSTTPATSARPTTRCIATARNSRARTSAAARTCSSATCRRSAWASWVPVATQIIHFTGYEVPFDQIRLDDPRDRKVGHLLGTADMMAQMSDRCYLEKCRDRLYPEFVLGGVAISRSADGDLKVVYGSGLDVLRQTPKFFADTMRTRLDGEFGGAYRCVEALYGGRNPYMDAIEGHLAYLEQVLRTQKWSMLRRTPPIFTWEKNPLQTMRALVIDRIRATVEAT